jgi:hypothetical protein
MSEYVAHLVIAANRIAGKLKAKFPALLLEEHQLLIRCSGRVWEEPYFRINFRCAGVDATSNLN